MKIAVCDDDRLSRESITELLDMYSENNPHHDIFVTVFEHPDDLLTAVKKSGGFDIYILEIIMPDTNGVELGIKLRADRDEGKIIYITSSEKFVFESFKAQAFNYLLKPVTPEKLYPVLDSATDIISYKKEKSIIVKTTDGIIRLSLDSIMYAELVNRDIVYHLANGKTIKSTTIRTSFSDAVRELTEDNGFILCGASLIVNLLHITASKTSELLFRGGKKLNVSRKLLAELRNKWCTYWIGKHEEGK